jgi:hypothetical protein
VTDKGDKIQQHKQFFSILLLFLFAIGIYFLYSYQFLPYSLGLHPDNVNNLNITSMMMKGINPNDFVHATPDEKELFNTFPAQYLFYSLPMRLFQAPVLMLSILNFLFIGIGFWTIYQVTKKWFDDQAAILSLLGCMVSVWFVLIFRLNFTAYIALCFLSFMLMFLYWEALEKGSHPSLIKFAFIASFGFAVTTWTILIVFLYLAVYSLLDPSARKFIFQRKSIAILLGIPGGILFIVFLLSSIYGVEGNFLGNYIQYFYVKRFPEHGGGVAHNTPLSSHFYMLNLMMNDYYEAVCLLWGHQRVVAKPVQIIQPFWLVSAFLGCMTSLLTRNKKEVFLASYVVFAFLILTIVFIPNERYFIIVIPFMYMLAAVFLVRILNLFPMRVFKKNYIFLGMCLGILVSGGISLKNNYFPYNKIINDYMVGAADRRRHGIEHVRQFIQKQEKKGKDVVVGYNINSDRIDIQNFYELNYSPQKRYLETQDFLMAAAHASKQGLNNASFIFDLSRFLAESEALESALVSLGFQPVERLYDLSGNHYKTIYYLGH